MLFLRKNYWLFILLNLIVNVAVFYTITFGVISIFLFIMVLTIVLQIKTVLRINNPNIAVHRPQMVLMYFVLSVLSLIPIGGTIFMYPYINNWFTGLTGYAQFIYKWQMVLIPVGIILFFIAVIATIAKINSVNQQYFNKKAGN